MRLFLFGEKLTGKAGILSLMDAIGTTVTVAWSGMNMMGGGRKRPSKRRGGLAPI